MKLHSAYLNPFQPFPELEINNRVKESEDGKDKPRHAIEDNMSRAVLSALANAESTLPLVMFLERLAEDGSQSIKTCMDTLIQVIKNINDLKTIEFGLQSWPATAIKEPKMLIGISSSHKGTWTHNKRTAPEYPKPDAWIYVPGKILLVFEFKNDEHPLDATQISAYAHYLKLFPENDDVPQAKAGNTLNSAEEAKKVQNACANLVLDASWSTVVEVFSKIQQQEDIDGMGRWLCGQAADYVKWHVFPPYRGIKTILEWLNGPDTPDRRNHLRRLVAKMGNALDNSKNDLYGGITFNHKGDGEKDWDLKPGSGSIVYVKLNQNGELLQRNFLGKKVGVVLWFQFAIDKSQRIGLEYYRQAKGSQTGRDKSETAWNKASECHLGNAKQFEEDVAELIQQIPPNSQMLVSTVRFNGRKKNWQGGGKEAPDALVSPRVTPEDALDFIKKNKEKLWRFPRVGFGEEFPNVEAAAHFVCKPALSLLAPLDINKLNSCGEDVIALQKYLIDAVEGIKG